MIRTPDDARPADAEVGQPGDERSLADAGLPQEGETAGSGTPGRARFSGSGTGSTTVRPA